MNSKNPIAPKSNAAFYGAAKIDKIFELQNFKVSICGIYSTRDVALFH